MKTSHIICENQTYERSFCLIELALSFNLSLIILLHRCKALLRDIDNERNKNKKRGCGKTDRIRRHNCLERLILREIELYPSDTHAANAATIVRIVGVSDMPNPLRYPNITSYSKLNECYKISITKRIYPVSTTAGSLLKILSIGFQNIRITEIAAPRTTTPSIRQNASVFLQRRISSAPKYCPTNVVQACENELSISYVKTLILNAALEAAIMTVPRLFIADCTTMFETANTALCIPAGSPICRICFRIDASMRSRFISVSVKKSFFLFFTIFP